MGTTRAALTQWSPWQRMPETVRFTENTLTETVDGGQSFRWVRIETDDGLGWEGCVGQFAAQVRLEWESDGERRRLQWRCPKDVSPATAKKAVERYFSVSLDFDDITDQLPWRGDPVLRARIEALPGLRILHQTLPVSLLCFLCSSNKRIIQIKEMVAKMAANFGQPIPGGWYALPTWQRLASATDEELRACKLGYRAKFIAQTAAYLKEHPDFLQTVEAADYPEAHALLMQLPGVGAKIADCVLLYGACQLQAFPVDTWIIKAMSRHYGLAKWSPLQTAHFGRIHFAPAPGLAQQYLFATERRG